MFVCISSVMLIHFRRCRMLVSILQIKKTAFDSFKVQFSSTNNMMDINLMMMIFGTHFVFIELSTVIEEGFPGDRAATKRASMIPSLAPPSMWMWGVRSSSEIDQI